MLLHNEPCQHILTSLSLLPTLRIYTNLSCSYLFRCHQASFQDQTQGTHHILEKQIKTVNNQIDSNIACDQGV